MKELVRLLGREHGLDDLAQALARYVRSLRPAVVGAMQITCADELECECIRAFQRNIADELLPELEFGQKSAFRLANLSGRYEPGALPVAEHHFATPESVKSFKVLLVKINSHVAVEANGPDFRFGAFRRYGQPSVACGALHALLEGLEQPFTAELERAFRADDRDRLAVLRDPKRVPAEWRALLAALVHVRLQTRRIATEISRHKPASPTVYVVAACTTLNRPTRDTELFCGLYLADQRTAGAAPQYWGLGDDPAAYKPGFESGALHVTDPLLETAR
jgi:hypothetical protein